MRRGGLILMVAVLPVISAGIGWLAAEWPFGGAMAEPDRGAELAPQAGATAKALAGGPHTAPLRAAFDRTGTLEGEVARLRWALAEQRRACRAAPPPAADETPPHVLADAGPTGHIANPERDEPAEAAPPSPAFAPDREPAPQPPVQVAAAEPTAPPAASTVAPPAAPATVAPGQALRVPESAVQTGDLGFLDGCWMSSPFANPVNGVSATKVYCFDGNGNGQMNFQGVDGVSCSAPIRARWEPGRRLVLEEPRDGSCSNYGPWYREATTCTIGGNGQAQCNSYEFFRRFNYGTLLTRI